MYTQDHPSTFCYVNFRLENFLAAKMTPSGRNARLGGAVVAIRRTEYRGLPRKVANITRCKMIYESWVSHISVD
jgi:hypothetical protein